MNYQDYIKTELLALIPANYFLGICLKKSRLPDKWIPLVIGIFSITMSFIWVFSSVEIMGAREIFTAIFTAVTQGLLTASASVYANQLYIQSKKEE